MSALPINPVGNNVQAEATFVFLNCQQLDYLPSKKQASAKKKKTPVPKKLPSPKLDELKAVILDAAGNQPPDLIGLCEVRDKTLATELAESIAPGRYEIIMSTPDTETLGTYGLALCYNKALFSEEDIVRDRPRRPLSTSRSFWLAAKLRFATGTHPDLWLILNHWKSKIGGELETEIKRVDNFREMEELFRTTSDLRSHKTPTPVTGPLISPDDYVLIAGDFNCEPGSRPLCFPTRAQGIEIRRHLGAVVGITRDRMLFMNTMWTAMGSPDANAPDFLQGTYTNAKTNDGPQMFDQILVSRALLEPGSVVKYVPGSTRIVPSPTTATDHAAVTAKLVY